MPCKSFKFKSNSDKGITTQNSRSAYNHFIDEGMQYMKQMLVHPPTLCRLNNFCAVHFTIYSFILLKNMLYSSDILKPC